MSNLELFLAANNQLGEGPLWHPVEQILYWVDIVKGEIHSLDTESGDHRSYVLGTEIGVAGLRASGGFVVATKKGFGFWDKQSQKLDHFADPEPVADARFNDGSVDPAGRFWAGKLSDRPENGLFRLDADLTIHKMESGLSISNGIGWSPDHKTMYFTDSKVRIIYAYDYDIMTGDIKNRRNFVELPASEGVPDGLTVDADGYVWSAIWGGWKVKRFAPDGSVEREIPVPAECPSSCTFGGKNLDELYITSAFLTVEQSSQHKSSGGDLFRLKTSFKGQAANFFKG